MEHQCARVAEPPAGQGSGPRAAGTRVRRAGPRDPLVRARSHRNGDVICHNDFAPYNCIFHNDRIAAVIDWDFAAPAPRDWDLVHALWRFTPLYPPAGWWLGSQPPFTTARLVHRMRRLCHGYGTELRPAHLNLLERRQIVVFDTVKTVSANGVPGFESMFADAETEADFAELAHLRRIKAGLAECISR